MNEYDEKWEEKINALLDGDLSHADAELLKSEAADDRELAKAIVEAYQLQRAMEAIKVEKAPPSLTRKLNAIPRKESARPLFGFLQPRWVMAMAVVPLVLFSVSLMQPETPSADEIAKARQEMAIAFAYLDKAGMITGREIESTVGDTLSNAVTGSLNKAIQSQNEHAQEKEV